MPLCVGYFPSKQKSGLLCAAGSVLVDAMVYTQASFLFPNYVSGFFFFFLGKYFVNAKMCSGNKEHHLFISVVMHLYNLTIRSLLPNVYRNCYLILIERSGMRVFL